MKLLHFTNIHQTTPGDTIGGRDPNVNFAKGLAHAMTRHADAEAMFVTGDLSDWGDSDDDTRLKAQMADLPMPVHLMIGNHDDRSTFARTFSNLLNDDGFVQYAVPLSVGTALRLDT